ncbi:hypothetical protein [Microbulbifer agarilyticus]
MSKSLSTSELIRLHEGCGIEPVVLGANMVLTPKEQAKKFLEYAIHSGLIVPDYESFALSPDEGLRVEEMGIAGHHSAVGLETWFNILDTAPESVTHYEFFVFHELDDPRERSYVIRSYKGRPYITRR